MEFPDLKSIQRRRKLLGITQKELAKKCGISQSLLTKIERGIVVPNYNTAVALFNTLEDCEHDGDTLASDVMHSRVIILKPSDTVEKAAMLSRKYAISQFPVVQKGSIVGSVSTSEMIWSKESQKVGEIMGDPFPIVGKNTPISIIKTLLKSAKAVIVTSRGAIAGIITAEDLL